MDLPDCMTCRRQKNPWGRDAPLAMGPSLCDYDCPGYMQDPKPTTLWPEEMRERKEEAAS